MKDQEPIRAGAVITDEMVDHIFNGVTLRTLPRAEWTHPAHLVFATALLDRVGLAGAEEATPAYIRAYNESVGGVNDDSQGYHHTITLFFLRHIDGYYRDFAQESVGARATHLLASPLSAPDYPLRYYSKDRLFSIEARRGWVDPDREND
ncbi:MAG: hypothetical protein AB7F91_07490 [Parvularculaceae bacterium]